VVSALVGEDRLNAERPAEGESLGRPYHPMRQGSLKRMASPSYGIDVVALAFAIILAAALAFLLTQLVPQVADLMMTPPPLSGAH
jgi:hypothetical protein